MQRSFEIFYSNLPFGLKPPKLILSLCKMYICIVFNEFVTVKCSFFIDQISSCISNRYFPAQLTLWEICSDLLIKTSEWRQWYCSAVFTVNFEQILLYILFSCSHCWLGTSKCQLGVGRWNPVLLCFSHGAWSLVLN